MTAGAEIAHARIREIAESIAQQLHELAPDIHDEQAWYFQGNRVFWVTTGKLVRPSEFPVPGDRVVAFSYGQTAPVDQVIAMLTDHPYWNRRIHES